MSGHSKWSTIKRKKGAKDAARSKIWSRLTREIIVAAKLGGGDPEANTRLRSAILAAKAQNMPNANIERAIKRGTGEIEGAVYEEVSFEGYGPGGVAILVECQTDNRNRTTAEVRHVFTKYNGNLGTNGCVSYLFERKGSITLDPQRVDVDTVMEAAIEAGAEDVLEEEDAIVVTTAFADYNTVLTALQEKGLPVVESEIVQQPGTTVKVTGKDALNVLKLISALDDLDDVSRVSANFDIDDAELAALQEQL